MATDLLIIGCGIAGCSAALEAARQGLSVLMITKSKEPEESNTFHAQGGIIYKGRNDSEKLLMKDCLG